MTGSRNDNELRLRGHITAIAALILIAYPVLQQLSWIAVGQWSFLLIACFVAAHDTTIWLLESSRSFVKSQAGRIVLDDVLCNIFDPSTGIISICAATIFGNAALYLLPATVEQRVQLMQHVLNFTGYEVRVDSESASYPAEKILQEPGGFTQLLPYSFQEWLADNEHHVQEENDQLVQTESGASRPVTTPEITLLCDQVDCEFIDSRCPESEKIQTGLDVTFFSDETFDGENSTQGLETPPRCPRLSDTNRTLTTSHVASEQQKEKGAMLSAQNATSIQATNSTSPLPPLNEIIGSILQDSIGKYIQNIVQAFPDGCYETMFLSAGALLFVQFRYSQRSRDILRTLVETSAIFCGCGTLLTSLFGLVARSYLQNRDHDSKQLSAKHSYLLSELGTGAMIGRKLLYFLRVKGAEMFGKDNLRKLKGIIAALVFLQFWQRHQRALSSRNISQLTRQVAKKLALS